MPFHSNHLFQRQSSDCVVCGPTPPCNCAANQQCVQISRDCNTCGTFKCLGQQNSNNSNNSGGVGTGALAGAVVGSLILVAIVIAIFLWYRRRPVGNAKEKPDIPASAEDVLNRPDPIEKSLLSATELSTVRVHANTPTTAVHPNPESTDTTIPYTITQMPNHPNPFDDGHSIQTTGTDGTNVIPIAFVPPESPRSQTETLSVPSGTGAGSPVRPARSPDVNLNLDHVNVSRDSLRATSPNSHASGISTMSARHSFMSGASFSSDVLTEAPMIMTPTKGTIRQVVGVVKAEVIKTPTTPVTPVRSDTLKLPRISRPSPLAMMSFGPADMARDSVFEPSEPNIAVPVNPFGDEHSPRPSSGVFTNTPGSTTFGEISRHAHDSTGSNWAPPNPPQPWTLADDTSRPSSLSTQDGSVIDISSATRVTVGLTPNSSSVNPRSPYRTTMGRLVSPPTNDIVSTLEEQQQKALAHAQARVRAQGLDIKRRVSGSSVISAASTRADSILESFPFVPPSPISDRPVRSPPCSPLGQQAFNSGGESAAEPPRIDRPESNLPPPPDRRLLGLSAASQFSTSSSGLGSFPFHVEAPPGQELSAPAPAVMMRRRASLDTLALTSDLSSYPLELDEAKGSSVARQQKN